MSRAYYNEIDPFAAQWLRNLIAAGRIAPGDVDERSILDVCPADLDGYTQCHFFAGIGIWSGALRDAGWPDDKPVWTGSCPCQPFSAAGQRGGFDDERHLWPALHWLIEQCRPPSIFGEQVASPDGLVWLDLVSADMEGSRYTFGAADTCAAGAGVDFAESLEGQATLEWIRGALLHCPDPFLAAELSDFAAWAGAALGYGPAHIRQRLYWMADRDSGREHWRPGQEGGAPEACEGEVGQQDGQRLWAVVGGSGATRALADITRARLSRPPGGAAQGRRGDAQHGGAVGDVGDARSTGLAFGSVTANGPGTVRDEGPSASAHGAAHGSDWIVCTDGKARPTLPGILPLAHAWSGPSRVALLRASGNALVKAQAAQFIRAAREVIEVGSDE